MRRQCGQFNNPADFALDVITGEEAREVRRRAAGRRVCVRGGADGGGGEQGTKRKSTYEDAAEKKAALAEVQRFLTGAALLLHAACADAARSA